MRLDVVHEAVVQTRKRAIGLSAVRVEFSLTLAELRSSPEHSKADRNVRRPSSQQCSSSDRDRVVELVRQTEQPASALSS